MRGAVPFGLGVNLTMFAITAVFSLFWMRRFLPGALKSRFVQALAGSFTALVFAMHLAWGVAEKLHRWRWEGTFGVWSSVVLIVYGFVAMSLPLTSLVWRVLRPKSALKHPASPPYRGRTPTPAPPRIAVSRRQIAQSAAATIPMAAAATALSGFRSGRAAPETRPLDFAYADLHPDLDGFRILQLSDLHLGYSRSTSDIERCLKELQQRPDLIVLTGDVADDLHQLERALDIVRDYAPRLGVLACLGNHEYLNDITFARRTFDKTRVELLVNEGRTLQVGNARLHVAGVDDPVSLHKDVRATLDRNVGLALRSAPAHASDTFRLLLSHRPEAFDAAIKSGMHLTLSGHTHGGHIGFNGHSAFESIWPEHYLWGELDRAGRKLYTTSGFGHWFPFRLGCPTEAPMITLRRA